MEKIVNNGDRDCTVILDGTECSIKFDRCFRAYSVQNNSASDAFISIHQGASAGEDGVVRIKSGCSAVFAHMRFDVDTVYLSGTGEIQVHGQNDTNNSFRNAPAVGGGVTGEGDPVVMDGLQGGVPFSEITVSGDNISGNEITLSVCGKNLLNYTIPSKREYTVNNTTFTVNDDGSVSAVSSAAEAANTRLILPLFPIDGDFVFSGSPSPAFTTYIFDTTTKTVAAWANPDPVMCHLDGAHTYALYFMVSVGAKANGEICKPQLEIGSAATDYEPYHGSTVKITPDSNPYVVPNDIRQQDGHNVVSVSNGTLNVTGCKKNAALKRIWDKIDELTTAVIVSNGE